MSNRGSSPDGRNLADGIDFGTVIVRGPLSYCRYEPKLGLGQYHVPRRFPRRRQYWLSENWWKPGTWEWFRQWQGKSPWEQIPPTPREGADTFVMHGDVLWGNSIAHRGLIDDHSFNVVGWTTPKPRAGDILVSKCESGQWGQFVLREIDHAQGVSDMWFAVAVGCIGYVDEPRTKRATEYVNRGPFV